jgi:hypothetical protein
MMVVIGIIVMILALAVPLFSVLRGGRSVDAGQNIVSATLERARARAIWLQEGRGVLFFDDQTVGKTAMLIVKMDPNGTLRLDQQGQEPEYLPSGIGAAFVWPGGAGDSKGKVARSYHPYGLVMFDGQGRAETVSYRLSSTTDLGTQYKNNLDGSGLKVFTGLGGGSEYSEVAVVLFDRRLLAEQDKGSSPNGYEYSTAQQDWLDNNALALVVNRYNGTLLRGE